MLRGALEVHQLKPKVDLFEKLADTSCEYVYSLHSLLDVFGRPLGARATSVVSGAGGSSRRVANARERQEGGSAALGGMQIVSMCGEDRRAELAAGRCG